LLISFSRVYLNVHYLSDVIAGIGLGLFCHGEKTYLEIGDNNKIREFTLINPGTEGGGGITKIGNNNLLMGYVHVAHDCIIGDNCILANAATLAGHVVLENNVVIGGMTPIHQFVKIGEFAMVAGASAVSQDIPPYCLAEGNRAKLRGLNITGLRRNLENRSDIDEIKRAYKELFESGKPLQETAKKLLESTQNKYVKHLCEFVLNSKRGIPYVRKV
jgi:UDP-N-acetylglucosamine acyltransferase